jgi:hypothetical protein
MDESRATEARHLERFGWRREALRTRFCGGNPQDEE